MKEIKHKLAVFGLWIAYKGDPGWISLLMKEPVVPEVAPIEGGEQPNVT